MRYRILTTLVGLLLSASVVAAGPNESTSPLDALHFRGLVQDSDVGLAFGFLREALSAAIEGREVAPPHELAQRAEAIADEVKRRGVAAGHAILEAIESSVRESLREPARLPPTRPLQSI